MAGSAFEIVWRNPLPIWARQVEQAAGRLELIKTPTAAVVNRVIPTLAFASADRGHQKFGP